MLLFSLREWIFDLFTTIEGRDEDKESAPSYDQAKGSSGFVACIVWRMAMSACNQSQSRGPKPRNTDDPCLFIGAYLSMSL